MTKATSKKDQIKEAVMTKLNKTTGAVTRTDINKVVADLGSTRTISRALAELKTEGRALQSIDSETKTHSWTSLEANKNDKKEKTPAKKAASKTESKGKAKTATKETGKKGEKVTRENLKEAAKGAQAKARKSTVKRNPAGSKTGRTGVKGKKPGVIVMIIKSISKKARTKKQILDFLVKKFPDRDPQKMAKTIGVQVPSRLSKEKGLKITKTDKGAYQITEKSFAAYQKKLAK